MRNNKISQILNTIFYDGGNGDNILLLIVAI